MSLQADCIFCKILRKEVPAEKVFENENVFAFKDIHPQAKHHYLIIPKFHVTSLAELKEEQIQIIEQLYRVGFAIAEKNGFKQSGFRTVINTGKMGGQTVFHLHMHLMSDDKISPRFG